MKPAKIKIDLLFRVNKEAGEARNEGVSVKPALTKYCLSFNATSKRIPPVRFVAQMESTLSGIQQDKVNRIPGR